VTFADPYLLALIAIIPLFLLIRLRRRGDSAAGPYSNLGLFAAARSSWRIRFRWLPMVIGAAAMTLLVVALARPQTGQAESELPGQGIDIALVLDTSGSMTSGFGDGTRLETAQRVLGEFISNREEDRLGLVVFRDTSLVLSPLTLDYDALQQLLTGVDLINLPDGTAIGVGLADALNLLRESRARSRVAILLTDGQNNGGDIEPLAASRIAETLGVRLYTIGLIEENSRRSGRVNVDENALQEMAGITGGRYFPAESPEGLSQIYESINELEKSRVGRPQFARYDELAPYFLVAALALLVVEVGLSSTIWRRA
jgi:Ca-activated chloride channel family protein